MPLVCTYPVSPYPPPPVPGPPVGGGDGCLVASWHCECQSGTPVWVNDTGHCVSNSACTGTTTCSASVYSIEMIGGCSGGVPNVPLSPPPQGVPPCNPTCCAPTGCCTKTKYVCQCYGGAPSWSPVYTGNCVPNTQCNPTLNNVSTGQVYVKENLNACTCGNSTGPEDVAGRLTASCCAQCTYVYTAQCFNNGQGWVVSAPNPTACAACTPTGWAPSANNACIQMQTACGDPCSTANGIADCQTAQALIDAPLQSPQVPAGALPPCCQNNNGNGGCMSVWNAQCSNGAWQTPTLANALLPSVMNAINPACVPNCGDYAHDWFGSGCFMSKITCGTAGGCLTGSSCSASPPATPSSIPSCCSSAPSPCLGGSACQSATQNAVAVAVPGVSAGDPWCIGLASTPFPATVPFNVHTGSTWQWVFNSGSRQIIVNVTCSGSNVTANITIGGVTTNVTWSSFPAFVTTLGCVGGHITGSVTLPLVGSSGQTLGGIKGTGNPCGSPDIAAPSTVTLTFS